MGNVFISKTGSDSNDGSEGSPFLTFFKACQSRSNGDTITILDSGTYEPGDDDANPSGNGRILLNIGLNIVAATGQTPTISGAGARASSAATKTAFNCSNCTSDKTITFQGITFDDFTTSANTIITSNTVGSGGPTQQFTDCIFQNMDTHIIERPSLASSGTPHLLDRCEIKSSGGDQIFGPDSHMSSGAKDRHIVIQNSIFHNTTDGSTLNYCDVVSNNKDNTIIRNSTFLMDRGNSNTTIVRFGVVENVIIKNINAGSVNDGLTGIDASLSYSNNCVNGTFGTTNGAIKDNTGSGATDGGGNITTDPLFVNQSSIPEGLKLQSGSPCVGTGKTIAAVTVDFDGTSRSAPYDMGAFHFTSGGGGGGGGGSVSFTTNDGSEPDPQKYGPIDFELRTTANKLFTRKFADDTLNRQAPFFVSTAGPANIRERKTVYKVEVGSE